MRLKLDAKTVVAVTLPKGQDELFVWDTELEGFGYRLRRGAKRLRGCFVIQYRARGHSRRLTIGDANKLTAVQARDAARKLLARIELGHDPQAEKETDRVAAARTFRSVAEAYLAAKKSRLRPNSYRGTELYLTGPYFRPLHAMAIGSISRADLAARISTIARDNGGRASAIARSQISAMFTWAMQEGWLDSNPVIGTRKPKGNPPRDRVLSDAELIAIWNACGDGNFGRILRLLILLGNRRAEVADMRWSELNPDGTWTLPKERSKNGRSNTVTLPAPALAIINAVPRGEGELLFSRRSRHGFADWTNAKADLDGRLPGTVRPWRLHDVRRTVATGMADIGIEPHIIEACLNHYGGHRHGVAGVYNRSTYDHQVKAALARWADHVLALVEGREESNVFAIHA
jgi:integrase